MPTPFRLRPATRSCSTSWDFGDPNAPAANNTASTPRASHVYTAVGSYNVLLSVLDDTGQHKTFTKAVSVTAGQPRAAFTFAVTGTHTITVDGSGSSAAGTSLIATYGWTWGDGSPTTSGTSAIVSHPYAGAGTNQVTLTVTDTLGRVGTTTQTVTVP